MSGEKDGGDPWQGSTPECSSTILPLRDASHDVLAVSIVEAGPTPKFSCDSSSSYSSGDSTSSNSSKSLVPTILSSSSSSSILAMLLSIANVFQLPTHNFFTQIESQLNPQALSTNLQCLLLRRPVPASRRGKLSKLSCRRGGP